MLHTLIVLGCLIVGAPPQEGNLPQEVRQLVAQLSEPQLATREAAEKRLLDFGPAALAALPPDSAKIPAEARQRLTRVRQQLERQAAEAPLKPSLVSLRGDDLTLPQVLSSLQQQTGNSLVDGRQGRDPANPRLRVQFDHTPFWPALDDVLAQTGSSLDLASRPQTIRLVAASPSTRHAIRSKPCYGGPFRFEVADISSRRDNLAVVSVEVAWEPRVLVIGLAQRIRDISAKAANGAALLPLNPEAQLEIPVRANASSVRFDVPLEIPQAAETIAQLRGSIKAMIAGRQETFRFANLAAAKNVEQRIAAATVTLEGTRKTARGYEVRMLLRFDDAGDALASHRTWIFNNPAYLETADGQQIRYTTFETTSQESNAVGLAFSFDTDLPLDQLTFVYQAPGAIFSREFVYDLQFAPPKRTDIPASGPHREG